MSLNKVLFLIHYQNQSGDFMKFIDRVKQMEGPGGTLETWQLNNGLYLYHYKNEVRYDVFFESLDRSCEYTKYIFDKLNIPANDLNMFYGGFFPPKITIPIENFERFVAMVEKMDVDEFEPDEFTG